MNIMNRLRARLTLLLACLVLIVLFWPWHNQILAPARIEPAQRIDVFPPLTAQISELHVENDAQVLQGDLLITLSSPDLDFQMQQSRARINLLLAQMARRNSNLQERRSGTILDDEYKSEMATLTGLLTQKDKLLIKAPQDGTVADLSEHMHSGRMVAMSETLMRISTAGEVRLIALTPEQDAGRIPRNAQIKFIADDPALPRIKTSLSEQAPIARASLDEAELTSLYGRKIAVHPDTDGGFIPVNPVYEVRANIQTPKAYKGRTIRGLAKIKGPRESYAKRIGRQIWRVLIREGDF